MFFSQWEAVHELWCWLEYRLPSQWGLGLQTTALPRAVPGKEAGGTPVRSGQDILTLPDSTAVRAECMGQEALHAQPLSYIL